jgi:HD-GYP domain-containing protein (c-di-GMP phosphodiesterase class II)
VSPQDRESLRAAEVIAPVCLATDLGMGFPLENGFHATLMANRFCDLAGIDAETSRQVYYATMLMYTGCSSEASLAKPIMNWPRTETLFPHLFGDTRERATGFLRSLPPREGTPLERGMETARRIPRLIAYAREQQTALCEVAEMLAIRLGLPSEVHGLFQFLTERWDGKSVLRRARGEEIPLAVRIFVMMRDIAFQRHWGGEQHAVEVARNRGGHAFDPELAEAFVTHADQIFAAVHADDSAWDAVLDAEPKPWIVLVDDEIDQALAAMGDFADLTSPSLAGHSKSVAALAAPAAEIAGLTPEVQKAVRRAAHVHDVGRVAVDPAIWDKAGRLSRDEYEQIRLHPYHTERILSDSPFLEDICAIARDHHEHLDGTGYHRGVDAASLSPPARLLAAVDKFQALTESRAHRPGIGRGEAARELARLAEDGCLDPAMVRAVIEAAGEPAPAMARPANLTDREAEVIGLLARGLQTKQIGRALAISPKTADTHIQSAYRKMGVSTRAAAALFAMEHGLVPSGELPIPD